jgi:hypothetical protein
MPNNAWPRSVRLCAFVVASRRRARLRDGEHGGYAAGEGQRGNDPSRSCNHCLALQKETECRHQTVSVPERRSALWRRLLSVKSQITSGSVLFRELQTTNEHTHRRWVG